jgi:predicted RNase H-like HicB family nuclease
MRYAIVIEKAGRNYSAYAPDLAVCVATAKSVPQVRREMRKAIQFHLDGMREDGVTPPKPASKVEYVAA